MDIAQAVRDFRVSKPWAQFRDVHAHVQELDLTEQERSAFLKAWSDADIKAAQFQSDAKRWGERNP